MQDALHGGAPSAAAGAAGCVPGGPFGQPPLAAPPVPPMAPAAPGVLPMASAPQGWRPSGMGGAAHGHASERAEVDELEALIASGPPSARRTGGARPDGKKVKHLTFV
eukprot:2771980-Prymnesium_polylepis.1